MGTFGGLAGFLDGTVTMDFAVASEERYAFYRRTLQRLATAD